MKTVLFILGGKVEANKPTAHFLLRTDAAIDYFKQNSQHEDIVFVVAGRWTSVLEKFDETEAEVAKQYILQALPTATVLKEDISVELIGNYAFSKPLISALQPNKVIIYTSELLSERNVQIAKRIFADDLNYEFVIVTNELSDNSDLVAKEYEAIKLFQRLCIAIDDGNDAAFRDTLLYATPYYFKGVINDEAFFNQYWDGGYEKYLHGRTVRKNL